MKPKVWVAKWIGRRRPNITRGSRVRPGGKSAQCRTAAQRNAQFQMADRKLLAHPRDNRVEVRCLWDRLPNPVREDRAEWARRPQRSPWLVSLLYGRLALDVGVSIIDAP